MKIMQTVLIGIITLSLAGGVLAKNTKHPASAQGKIVSSKKYGVGSIQTIGGTKYFVPIGTNPSNPFTRHPVK